MSRALLAAGLAGTCGVLLLVAATSQAGSGTRPCGGLSNSIGVVVSATPDVPCHQARRIMRKVLVGGKECYSGERQFHPCTIDGFHCTAKFHGEVSRGRCVKGRRLIVGRT